MDQTKRAADPAVTVALSYLGISLLWILLSDALLLFLGVPAPLLSTLNMVKGIGFVLVTAAMLYFYLRREFNVRFRLQSQLQEQLEQVQATQQGLRQSEERFRKAVEEAPLPILIFAEDGEILSISRTWLEITGYSQDQLTSLDEWTELAYGERKQVIRSVIDKLFSLDHRVDDGELTIRCADGEQRIWTFSSNRWGNCLMDAAS
ncbi:MAG: PAS domain S-box protein [Caldilineaceae bacterium]